MMAATGWEAMTAVDDDGDLVLEAGDARLVVAPGDGGRIASLSVTGRELLWTRRDDGPIYWGCYPMAPWAGRIRHGTFAFAGRRHRLRLTMPPHAIHGVVFDRAWRVDDDRTISIDLADPWPFPGSVVQRFDLAPGRLDVSLEVHADEPMPVVVGWHPWFRRVLAPDGAPARLRFAAREMLVRDGEGMPSGERISPPPGPWDDAFTGVAEPPVIEWPGALRLDVASSCEWWVVYDERDYALCVEPQSGPPDAVNLWPGAATPVAPGTPLVHRMTWRWTPLEPAGG